MDMARSAVEHLNTFYIVGVVEHDLLVGELELAPALADGNLGVVAVAARIDRLAERRRRHLVLLREPGSASDITLGDGTVVSTDAELLVLGIDDGAVLLARGTQVSIDGTLVATLSAGDGVAEGTATMP